MEKLRASERRILITKWFAKDDEDFTQNNQEAITKTFKKCGIYYALDESESNLS